MRAVVITKHTNCRKNLSGEGEEEREKGRGREGGGSWIPRDIAVIYESRSLTAGDTFGPDHTARAHHCAVTTLQGGYFVGSPPPPSAVVVGEHGKVSVRRRLSEGTTTFEFARILVVGLRRVASRRAALAARSNVVPRSSRFSASVLTTTSLLSHAS